MPGMEEVFIALGSNMGDRLENLRSALKALTPHVEVTHKSLIYESEPMYVESQPRFLNMVIRGQTALEPRTLLSELRMIEKRLGRIEAIHNGPRPLDLDILYYGEVVMDDPTLSIPHPRMHERPFVIVPMAELAPLRKHEQTGKVFADLEDELGDYGDRLWAVDEL